MTTTAAPRLSWLARVRGAIRLTLLVPVVIIGLVLVSLGCARLPGPAWRFIAERWARVVLWVCGLRVQRQGEPPLREGALWVSNHVSWIDICVLNRLHQLRFVSKADVRGWPVVGWLASAAGTIFIDRTQRLGVREATTAIQARFDRREVVGLFAEGTTTTGFDVLPFHPSLFEPALACGAPVQPIALRFLHQGQRSALASYAGDDGMGACLWRIVTARQLSVEVVFLPPIDTRTPGLTRRELSQRTHAAILAEIVPPGACADTPSAPAATAEDAASAVALPWTQAAEPDR